MADTTYTKTVCPHVYYPNNPEREMFRVEMFDGNTKIGFADYFVENGWSHFLVFNVAEKHRNTETNFEFIKNVYQIVPQLSSFWWNTPPVMEPYFDMIVAERPDMTFAAGGAIKKVVRATA